MASGLWAHRVADLKDHGTHFAYGYECCVFKHNICGDHPEVPEGMPDTVDPLPPVFFVNPG